MGHSWNYDGINKPFNILDKLLLICDDAMQF